MKSALLLLLCAPLAAHAADREVRLLVTSGSYVTGDAMPAQEVRRATILFTSEPCPLAPGDGRLLRAWVAGRVGCWTITVGGIVVRVDGEGRVRQNESTDYDFVDYYALALLHPDGSATITEPEYNSATFITQVTLRKARELRALRERRERP